MGEGNNESIGRVLETGGGGENSDSKDTEKQTEGRKTGAGAGAGGNTEKEPIPELVVLSEEGKPVKQRKKRKKKEEKNDSKNLEELLTVLLKSITDFTLLPVDNNLCLSIEECESIAKPGAAIIGKNLSSESVEKYGDWVVLLTAVSMVAMPRILYVYNKKSKKKEVENESEREIKKDHRYTNEGDSRRRFGVRNVKEICPVLA